LEVNKLLKSAEIGFTIVSLMILFGSVVLLVLSGGQQEYEDVPFDSSLIRINYFIIYAITIFLLMLRWKKTLETLRQDYWIFSLVLLCVVSIFWSFEQANTLKDSVTIVGSSLFGFYFGARYTLKQQLELLGWAFGIIVILCFVFVIALPKYGIMGGIHQGKWRGVFSHKNGLGQAMVYSSLIFMFLIYQSKKHKLLMAIGLSSSMLLLLLSASTSSMFNLFILICVFFVIRTFRLPYLLMIPAILAIVTVGELVYFWFINNAEGVFSSFGKDTTLTGRTDLWPLVIEMIGKQPWIGYGYGGFWQGLNGVGSAYIWRATGWLPSHPHNGFLQILLDLGVLGLGVFTIGYIITFIRSFAFLRSYKTVDSLWPLLHLVQLLLNSLTESQLLVSNNVNWILYVAVAFSLKPTSQHRSRS
jgi:exopolysaccharide production protein ExoQ